MSSDYQPPNPYSQFGNPPPGQPPGQPSPYGAPPPWGPNQGVPGGYYQPQTPSRLSLPSLFSLLSALFAPVLFCLCIPTILGSLAAVVLGHIGLYQVQRSEGRLHGGGLAIAGLLLGYPLLLISGVMAYFVYLDIGKDATGPVARFKEAESKIMTQTGGTAHGNTPEAEQLAKEFGSLMKELREALFTEDKRKAISLSGGNFVTYCELHDGKCAFLVHVPAYRKFDDDAKESLAELAWMTAQSAVEGTLAPGDDLAVGMKGSILYGSVMIGKVAAEDEESEPDEEGTDKDALLPFFEGDDEAPAAALADPEMAEPETDLSEPVEPVEPVEP